MPITLRRAAGLLPGLLFGLTMLQGAPRAAPLDDYQHTQWKAENGAPAEIRSMAQTTDGWLWLGTSGGLYRFDGVHFERAAGELGHVRIHEMYAGPRGDLFIGEYVGALKILHPDGRVEAIPGSDSPSSGTISAMAQAEDGTLWALGRGVFRWDGQHWLNANDDPVWQHTEIRSLVLGVDGAVWAAHDHGVMRRAPGATAFVAVDRHGGGLSLGPDGAVWLLPKDGTRVRQLAAPSGNGRARPARFNPSGSRFTGLFDTAGTLWKLRCPQPLCIDRTPAAATASFDTAVEPWQLSGTETRQILEDREGDIWIATHRGLDRFRRIRLRRAALPAGADAAISMAADAEGRVWAADSGSGVLWQLGADGAFHAVPGPQVSLVVPDGGGGILLGGLHAVWRQAHGRRTAMPLPPGSDGNAEVKIWVLLDDGKIVWAAGPGIGLIGWQGGKWHPYTDFKLDDKLYILKAAGGGQMWIGRAGGELLHYDNDRLTRYDAGAIGFITGIMPGPELIVGGDGGLGVLVAGKIRMLRAANPDVLRGISGMVTTADGDRWLNGAAGIIHVRAGDWRRALDQDIPLRYELFDTLDGYPGRALVETSQPTALSADGRHLWFIGSEGVAGLDTAGLQRNGVRPTPVLKGVHTAQGMLAPGALVRIPAGSGRFGVQFTAPALRMPERIRFEYRLDGFDAGWQDAGARRSADYTNMPPGRYRFRVRAYNEDGLPGGAEAVQALVVEPSLVQTLWFRLLVALLLVALGCALYAYRVRYLTARLTERLRVKTAERERIARALHDSFLQSVQSLLMQVDATAARLPADMPARRELETIREQAREALVEGRGHLAELRADESGRPATDLEGTLCHVLDGLRALAPAVQFTLRVDGRPRALRPEVADDIANIAREALRNAAVHAGGRTVAVTLEYGARALRMRVSDDGVGLDATVAHGAGKPGHWGLAGMRERAAQIGADLAIESWPGAGTTVSLTMPAKRAYADG